MHGEEPARDRYETLSRLLDKYASHIFQNEQKQVLDIGCATGHLLAYFHVHGWRTRGLEISPETAAYAQEKLGIDVIVGDLPEVGLPAEAFDLITMYHLIEHLIDPRAYLSECRRILKPRGALFIETPNFDGLGARIQGPKWSHITPPEHLVYFDPWSLLNLVQGVRLKVVYVRTVKARYIESIQGWPPLLKQLGQLAYSIAPYFNLGTTIHVLAIKE
jgi:2-polyprenyl-3-methyl-5-hydroxy-6-metoxy-1,4-benzoquinol methylase